MSAILGLGTYKVHAAAEAACTACEAGAAWVDTAPNYGDGETHQLLAPVLTEHPQVKVATKTGFLTPTHKLAAVAAGVLEENQARTGHSLAPAFVRWQTEQSLHELGRADVVFVHNPERSARHRLQVHAHLRKVFEVLEEFACAGRIGGYGVATWTGFESDIFTVPGLVGLARQAAGGQAHHMVAVQQPVSLVMDRPIRQSLGGRGPLVQARAAGLTTFASSPLYGGELIDLVTPELVDFIRPGLSPAAACLLVAASTPSLDVVLLSASGSGHWAEAAAALALPLDARQLTEVTDVCAAG
ncbi:aldo/keto reductase [Streptomyces sp. C36]|uniref:aldo/keto reductase n=1 Tax=Streptomyces sp. C36 TaxID=3237122 RepID=UPI0034C6D32F